MPSLHTESAVTADRLARPATWATGFLLSLKAADMRKSPLILVLVTTLALLNGIASPATGTVPAQWTGTWSTALTMPSGINTGNSKAGFADQSLRMLIRTSIGGDQVRIRLSNIFGEKAVEVGHVSVGIPVAPASPDLVPGSIRSLTFAGSPSATIYKGADLVSDPLPFHVEPLTNLAVTLYFPVATGQTSWHGTAKQTTYVYSGNQAGNESGAGQTATYNSFYFIAAVDVSARLSGGAVVVLGDSISDGSGSTLNTNHKWPDYLATRIADTPPRVFDPGVLNVSLAGNMITHDGSEIVFPAGGLSSLARLDNDVLSNTNVQTVIVELGINDIHFLNDTPERIIRGLRQLDTQLTHRGIGVVFCTIGPFEGFSTWTPAREATRVAVNTYLRENHSKVCDFDAVLRDPAAPTRVLAAYDSGDHIHPNDSGAAVLASSIPLWWL